MINQNAFYMNINTGTVQSGADWLDDLAQGEDASFLVEVEQVNGEWVEVS